MKSLLLAAVAVLSLTSSVLAQNSAAALAALPEADALLYVNPQRILNEAAPRVMPPAEITKMRAAFADIKKNAGIDPSTIEYVVVAMRFNKPTAGLSFVAPDVMIVVGGDFSPDTLITMAHGILGDKAREEKHGSKSITVMKIDPIAVEAAKNPILQPYAELGVVPLSATSIAIGNLRYLQAAVDAADGNGRISAATIQSLLRDPNVLAASTGTPLTAFAKAFGLLGLENTTRDPQCNTAFGNFYAALTMSGTSFNLRGAMNADNPDTAKIIHGLVSGLMQTGIGAVPDAKAQSILQSIKMSTRENEVVWEADIPEKVITDFLKPSPKVSGDGPATKPAPKRTTTTTKRKRSR